MTSYDLPLLSLALMTVLVSACAKPQPITQQPTESLHETQRDDAFEEIEVIALGEASHGDGATFEVKAELVELLHTRHGFDVILFEAQLDRCTTGNKENLLACLPPIWSKSAQFEQLAEYLDTMSEEIEVGSFDSKHFQQPAHLLTMFEEELRSMKVKDEGLPIDALVTHFSAVVDALAIRTKHFHYDETLQQEVSQARKLLDAHSACAESDCTIDTLSRAQLLLENLHTSALVAHTLREQLAIHGEHIEARAPAHLLINARDAQMARNVLWLKRHRYPGKKILLWTANLHATTNLDAASGGERYQSVVTMGDHLANALGSTYAAVGFTAAGGHHGLPWQQEPTPLEAPKTGSIESMLSCTSEAPDSIARLEELSSRRDMAQDPHAALFLGYAPLEARWGEVFRFAFCHDAMTPSLRRQQDVQGHE